MKNKKIIIIILAIVILVVASIIIGDQIKTTARKEMDTINGITLTIKEGTLTSTGATVIIKDDTANRNVYGGACEYKVEKFKNKKWKKLYKKENCISTSQGHYVDENGILEIPLDWEETYGKLEKGKYRIIKNATLEKENKPYDFSVEFEIQ